MRTILRFTVSLALIAAISPAAFADLNPYYADIPSPICGPIDAYRACYAGGDSGGGGCPKNTSYSKCMEGCKCVYDNAMKDCEEGSKGLRCRESARMNRDLCEGGCLSDWPPAKTPPTT